MAEPPVDEPQTTDVEMTPAAAAPAAAPMERVRVAAAAAAPTMSQRFPEEPTTASPGPVRWLLGAGVVVLLLVSVIIGRNGIVGKFPATAAAYQAVGLSVDQDFGLEFKDVTLDWQREGGASVLVVEGEIVNLSEANQIIPPVRMAILGSDGEELQHEYFELEENELNAGDRVNFSGRLIDPIDQGENFHLSFGQDS